MVRPNAEVIPSEHHLSVKIVTQNPISKVSRGTTINSSVALLAAHQRQVFGPANQVRQRPRRQDLYARRNWQHVEQSREGEDDLVQAQSRLES